MSSLDLTRILSPSGRHLSGARLQQGRALLDSDFNEAAEARALLTRDTLRALLGPAAAPDNGFLPDLSAGDVLTARTVTLGSFFKVYVTDWKLRPGTLYAGGLRFVQDELEPVVFQRNFLQMGPGMAPRAALGRYRQLAVLRGFEQTVGAVEDGELMEAATGGVDTAQRVHRHARVEVYLVHGETCAEALAEVLAETAAGTGASYDPATAALRSNARLGISFLGDAADDCPACRPRLAGRYLGGEAHSIRIMLATATSYVWALDTPPLHRVKLVMEGSGVARIELLTPPRDRFLEPRHGAVVEFLPWAALLRNGVPATGKLIGATIVNEKVAAPVGFLGEALEPYNPATRSLRVRLSNETLVKIGLTQPKGQPDADTAAQQALKSGEPPAEDVIALEWDPSHPRAGELARPAGSGGSFAANLFMRVWHQKGEDGALAIPTAAPRPLGRTGLVPRFTGAGIAGDAWTVAVSPLRNGVVLPLDLLRPEGVPPHGPNRVLAPLALLEWDAAFGLYQHLVRVTDCRPKLPRLTDRGCTTVWVGPGDEGDTDSLTDAVHRLPAGGGRIRVLPGTYREEVRVFGRRNVVIEGCGPGTIIVSPEAPKLAAVVTVEPVDGLAAITLRRLAIVATGQAGFAAAGSGIVVEEATIRSEAGAAAARPAVEITDGGDVRITRSTFVLAGPGPHAAIYLECPGGEVLVEDNTVDASAGEGPATGWGGIQVAGGSRDVEIRGNRIAGGYGHGITLGSVTFLARNGAERRHEGAGTGQSEMDPPATTLRPAPVAFEPNEPDPTARLFYPAPDAAITDLLIAENRIEGAGASGIGSLALVVEHAEAAIGPPLCLRERAFRLANVTIRDNTILRAVAQPPREAALPYVAGGIALSAAADLTVAANAIEACGTAAGAAACGVYVGEGARLAIRSNRIRGNGPERLAPETPTLAGGIVVAAPAAIDLDALTRRDPRIDTVQVSENVVEHRDAPALVVVATGPVTLRANHLESIGAFAAPSLAGVTTALVVSPGRPHEALDIPPNEPDPQRWRQPAGSQEFLTGRARDLFGERGGGVLFCANTITTERTGAARRGGGQVAILILSTDAVTAVGNGVALRSVAGGFLAGALLAGTTAAASACAFTETVDGTTASLAVAAPLLASGVENTATHCIVVHAGANEGDADYEAERDNLVLLRPRDGGCDVVARTLRPTLAAAVASLAGLRVPGGIRREDLVITNRAGPRGGGQ
jgi:hypothetical protein